MSNAYFAKSAVFGTAPNDITLTVVSIEVTESGSAVPIMGNATGGKRTDTAIAGAFYAITVEAQQSDADAAKLAIGKKGTLAAVIDAINGGLTTVTPFNLSIANAVVTGVARSGDTGGGGRLRVTLEAPIP